MGHEFYDERRRILCALRKNDENSNSFLTDTYVTWMAAVALNSTKLFVSGICCKLSQGGSIKV